MPDRPLDPIDFPPRRSGRRRFGLLSVVLVIAVLFGAGTALSFYVDALWFGFGTIATMLVAVAAGAGALARVPLTPRAATAFSGLTCVICGALLFAGL